VARMRTIKPEFFMHEDLAECSPTARLLFIGLWTLADRDGRLKDRPKRIKAQVFPFDAQLTSEVVDTLLTELDCGGFIVRYAIENVACIEIVNFSKHQRIHANESASMLPPLPPDFRPKAHGLAPLEQALAPTEQPLASVSLSVCKSENGYMSNSAEAESGPRVDQEASKPDPNRCTVDDLVEGWNALSDYTHNRLPKVRTPISADRRRKAAARVRDHPDRQFWTDVLHGIADSVFLCGENSTGWKANFDWLLRPDSATKVIEGNYRRLRAVSAGRR